MELKFTSKPSKDSILTIPVFEKEKFQNAAIEKILEKLAASKDFTAKEGENFFYLGNLRPNWPSRILFAGAGGEKKLNTETAMNIFGDAVKYAAKHHPKKISILMRPAFLPYAQAISEAVCMANYHPSKSYKTGKFLQKILQQVIQKIEILGAKEAKKDFEKGAKIASVVNDVRDWVNAPPNFASVEFFEKKSKEIAQEIGAEFTVLGKKELEKLGMGALLAVNRGSKEEARLVVMDYTPKGAEKNGAPLVFVGKGIVFDSGGYNLKPSGHIEDMQSDDAGAAAVIGFAKLLPMLRTKWRVIVMAPLTDNAIGSNAVKPSEIIKTYSGKTIEITNTDAEGRMILCDAISYAIDKFKPAYLIDIATLTGSCIAALGYRYAGLLGNDKDIADKLQAAGREVDEELWPLPIHKVHAEKIKGYYADLKNAESGGGAGASKGAAFLQEFVGRTKWAHIDIAGPAFTKDPKKYEHKGGTGFGVRLLARFLEKL